MLQRGGSLLTQPSWYAGEARGPNGFFLINPLKKMFKNAAASVGLDDRRFEFKIQPPEMLRAGGRCQGGVAKKRNDAAAGAAEPRWVGKLIRIQQ